MVGKASTMTKKILIKSIIMVVLLTSILTISLAGWLSSIETSNPSFDVGEVEVELLAYYDIDGTPYEGEVFYQAESFGEGSFTKTGIYKINLSTPTDPLFIKNLRVNIAIRSKVDTYFRIAPYEQLTLTYQSGGKTVEVATTQTVTMPFKYQKNDNGLDAYFFDNRENDGYFYYTNKVQRVNETTELLIPFIADFGSDVFNLYEEKYSLQLGFIIEAVQSERGPFMNWGLAARPWDDQEW